MKNKKIIFVFVGLVINKKREILLVKRNEKNLPEAHNKWELPGGKIDFGEKIEQSVEREIFEETGYKIKAEKIIPKSFYSLWHYPKFDQYTIIFCVLCRLKNNKNVIKNDHHVKKINWFSLKEIKKLSLLPGVNFFIKEYINLKK